jgi:DNA replication protein DnaC
MKKITDILSNHPAWVPSGDAVELSPQDEVQCQICNDRGYLRYDVPVGHPSFGQVYACECRKLEMAHDRIDKLRRISNLSAFSGSSFEDFNADVPGTQAAKEAAMDFALDPTHRWLVLSGPVGVGKTHLGVAIAQFAIEQHMMNAYFAAVPDLMDHLRSAFAPGATEGYDERFEEIRNAQLLVLDDLGTENATPWAQEKLYQIINHRYIERLPTVITTNVDLRKIDDRVASRMLDHRLSTHVDIDATDYRRPGDIRGIRRPTGGRRR